MDVCILLCILNSRRVKRADLEPAPETDDVVDMMRDVYVFLFTRLTCFDEGNKLENSADEPSRLKDVTKEVNRIKPYLKHNQQLQSSQFMLFQGMILDLLERAQEGPTLILDPLVQQHMNDTGDVLLGSICLILSADTSLIPRFESCGINKSRKLIESVMFDYSARKKGLREDLGREEDRFLDLLQVKSCGYITSYQQATLRDTLTKQ